MNFQTPPLQVGNYRKIGIRERGMYHHGGPGGWTIFADDRMDYICGRQGRGFDSQSIHHIGGGQLDVDRGKIQAGC